MKKTVSRIFACFLACLIAFNTVVIPKAEAVVIDATAAFGAAALGAYMQSTGATIAGTSALAVESGLGAIASGYAAATGTTSTAVLSSVAAGATISTSGAIILGVGAVALLAAIVAWAIDEYGLEPGSETVPVYPGVGDKFLYNGVELPALPADLDVERFPYVVIILSSSGVYNLKANEQPHKYKKTTAFGDTLYTDVKGFRASSTLGDGKWTDVSVTTKAGTLNTYMDTLIWTSADIMDTDNNVVYMSASEPVPSEDWENPDASVSLESDYEAPPEVLETQQMVLDVGAGEGATEETIYNLVFNNIADGTLTSTYEITDADTGSGEDTGEDTGTETDTELGLLGRIANACEALADKILNGIASLFAPDPALMAEITDTFSAKFSFVPTLHQLGVDMLNMSPDTTPPVIYINLDHAEGSFDYGGQVAALDMAWYARYKEDVDRIMSGFLWLGFLWLVFKRASAIIQGAEMAGDYQADIDQGYRFRGERNGKRF